jgi:hypothetical protein
LEGLGRKPLVLLHSRHVQRSRLEAMNAAHIVNEWLSHGKVG